MPRRGMTSSSRGTVSCMVMANPVQRNLWGPEMSQERAQSRGKDGGAHVSPHETSFDDGILYLSKESLSSDVREIADANSLHLVQDGGTISLLSGDGEDMVDMYPYDQGVGDNTEWVKTKCKSLSIDFDNVNEENVGDILGLGTESKVDNLTIGCQFLGSGISEDNGIILCTDGVSLAASSISSGNDAKCSDIIPLCNMPDDLNSRTDQVLCLPSSQNTENSSNLLLSSSSSAPSSVFNDLTVPASLDNSSFTTFKSKAEPVEELTQSNQISLLETSFPNLTASSQSLLSGTCAIASSISDAGLASGILPNFLGIDSLTASPGNELGILNETTTAGIVESESVLLTLPESGDGKTEVEESSKIDLADPSNVTLAMISVSTDKDANSTQIVVNTSQGQQLYMINTASLNQVSNNVVPVAQPIESVSAVQGIPALQSAGTQNQYILLPLVTSAAVEGSQSQDDDERQKFICTEPGCGRTFSKASKLRVHAMQHTGERPFKCSREGCDWAFTTAYKLKRHEESHEGKKDFYCDYEGCNRKFTTIYNLKSHQRLHERPCTEKCPEEGCSARFPTKRHLETHMRTHTGEEKTYNCPYPGCDAVFYSAMSMGSHTRLHKEKDTELRCNYDGCGKVFDRMCRLKQHFRQHTGEKPYKCKDCTWAFTTASKLKRHSAKHLNLRKFKCDLCDKSFMRPEHLKGHLVTHSGAKPFTCTHEGCDASFTAKSSLYVHMNKHKQEEDRLKFYCPIDGCSRKYSSKPNLRAHILKHYVDVPEEGDISKEISVLLRSYASDDDPDGKEVAEAEECSTRYRMRKDRSGCARTDVLGNDQVSKHARQRWLQQREVDAQQVPPPVPMETDLSPAACEVSADMLSLVKQDGEIYTAADSSLATLSYQDPETGLTCIHTQLLQDDPPQTVYYSGDPIGLSGDASDLNQSVLDMVPSHFANTTINLNDLV